MTSMNDEVLFATLIELADTTTTGFDLVSMSDRLVEACVEVLGVTAAGIMLADQRKSLRVFASSDEETRILELLELQNNDGPCLEAFHTGTPIDGVDLSQHMTRWPHFAAAAIAAGFNSAYAVPMQLREKTIGALNLFQAGIEPFSAHKVNVARVLADMAAIGIINHWSVRQEEVLAQQLQSALNTRVIIEQAKGVVAERQGVTMGEAFDYLRATARASRRPITDVAMDTVNDRGSSDASPGAKPPTRSPRPPLSPPPVTPPVPGAPKSARPRDPGIGAVVVAEDAGPARNRKSAGPSTGTAVLVQEEERFIEPEVQSLDHVATAVALIRAVYNVKTTDALDILNEAGHEMNRSTLDMATQTIVDGRLPEEAIVDARRRRRQDTLPHGPDQDQHRSAPGS